MLDDLQRFSVSHHHSVHQSNLARNPILPHVQGCIPNGPKSYVERKDENISCTKVRNRDEISKGVQTSLKAFPFALIILPYYPPFQSFSIYDIGCSKIFHPTRLIQIPSSIR